MQWLEVNVFGKSYHKNAHCAAVVVFFRLSFGKLLVWINDGNYERTFDILTFAYFLVLIVHHIRKQMPAIVANTTVHDDAQKFTDLMSSWLDTLTAGIRASVTVYAVVVGGDWNNLLHADVCTWMRFGAKYFYDLTTFRANFWLFVTKWQYSWHLMIQSWKYLWWSNTLFMELELFHLCFFEHLCYFWSWLLCSGWIVSVIQSFSQNFLLLYWTQTAGFRSFFRFLLVFLGKFYIFIFTNNVVCGRDDRHIYTDESSWSS